MTSTSEDSKSVPPFVLNGQWQTVCRVGDTILMAKGKYEDPYIAFMLGNQPRMVSLFPAATSGQDVDISEDWQPLFQSDDHLIQVAQMKGAASVEVQINTNNVHAGTEQEPWWGSIEHKTLWFIDPAMLKASEPGEQSEAERLSRSVSRSMNRTIREAMKGLTAGMEAGIKSSRPDWLLQAQPKPMATDVMDACRTISTWTTRDSRSADYTTTNHIMRELGTVIPELVGNANQSALAIDDIVHHLAHIDESLQRLTETSKQVEEWRQDVGQWMEATDDWEDDTDEQLVNITNALNEFGAWGKVMADGGNFHMTVTRMILDALGYNIHDDLEGLAAQLGVNLSDNLPPSDDVEIPEQSDEPEGGFDTTTFTGEPTLVPVESHTDRMNELEGMINETGRAFSKRLTEMGNRIRKVERRATQHDFNDADRRNDDQHIRNSITELAKVVEGKADAQATADAFVGAVKQVGELKGTVERLGTRFEHAEKRADYINGMVARMEEIVDVVKREAFPVPSIGSQVRHRKNRDVGTVTATSSSFHSFAVEVPDAVGGAPIKYTGQDPMDWEVTIPAAVPVEYEQTPVVDGDPEGLFDAPEPSFTVDAWLALGNYIMDSTRGVEGGQISTAMQVIRHAEELGIVDAIVDFPNFSGTTVEPIELDAGVGWWEGVWICRMCGERVAMTGREHLDGSRPDQTTVIGHCPACNLSGVVFDRPEQGEPTLKVGDRVTHASRQIRGTGEVVEVISNVEGTDYVVRWENTGTRGMYGRDRLNPVTDSEQDEPHEQEMGFNQ